MRLLPMRLLPMRLSVAMGLIAASACVPAGAGYQEVRQLTKARLGVDVPVEKSTGGAPTPEVNALLDEPLTADSVASIALLNSPALQAEFARVGVARGELIGALQLPNPHIGAALRYAREDKPEVDVDVMLNLTTLLFLHSRQAATSVELSATVLEVTLRALSLAYNARRALYDYQAALAELELRTTAAQAFFASAEMAQRLSEAGNVPDVRVLSEQALYEEARIALARAEAAVPTKREALNALLGLWGEPGARWATAARLPLPEGEGTEWLVTDLEGRSIDRSLQIDASRLRFEAAAKRTNLARLTGWVPAVSAGATAERSDAGWAFGPAIDVSLPLFYQGNGEAASSLAEMRGHQARARAAAVNARAAARRVVAQLSTTAQMLERYQNVILPLREQVVNQVQLQYNAMNAGVFELLQAKRDQVSAGQTYVQLLRDYWRLRADAAELLAGSLPDVGVGSDFTQAMAGTPATGGAH